MWGSYSKDWGKLGANCLQRCFPLATPLNPLAELLPQQCCLFGQKVTESPLGTIQRAWKPEVFKLSGVGSVEMPHRWSGLRLVHPRGNDAQAGEVTGPGHSPVTACACTRSQRSPFNPATGGGRGPFVHKVLLEPSSPAGFVLSDCSLPAMVALAELRSCASPHKAKTLTLWPFPGPGC